MSYLISIGQDEAPPGDVVELLRAQKADLDEFRAILEKDLFWRRISVFVAITGATIGLARLADILIAVRRRRTD